MRGIMIHSLMSRGVGYDLAYRTANQVRERLRGRAEVAPGELRALVTELLGETADVDLRPVLPPSIGVVGEGRRLPFSKGVLAQSLLAAAIEQVDAFDVAREIERDLMARGVAEVERADLRRLACEALRQRMGRSVAERYLVWRRYQDPDKPVILLLGGAPGAGKTSLALEVAHRLGIQRVMSADSIRQIMRIMLSPELVPAVHVSSYEAWKVIPGAAVGEDPVIEGFLAQASAVTVGVRAMMDRAIAENTSLVLDGVSLLPGLLDVKSYEEFAHVIFLVVATLDVDAYENRFARRAEGERLRPKHRYLDHLDAIRRIQEHFLERADQQGVPIVDNDAFDGSVTSIVRYVSETLRNREPLDTEDWL